MYDQADSAVVSLYTAAMFLRCGPDVVEMLCRCRGGGCRKKVLTGTRALMTLERTCLRCFCESTLGRSSESGDVASLAEMWKTRSKLDTKSISMVTKSSRDAL